jgi:hypothetical protein
MELDNIENFKCSKCSEIKPLEKFTKKEADGQSVLFNSCNDCRTPKDPHIKKCNKCQKIKPTTDFYLTKANKYYASYCIECYKAKYAAIKALKSKDPVRVRPKDKVLVPQEQLVYTNKKEYAKAYTKKYYQLKKAEYKKRYESNKVELIKKNKARYQKKKAELLALKNQVPVVENT